MVGCLWRRMRDTVKPIIITVEITMMIPTTIPVGAGHAILDSIPNLLDSFLWTGFLSWTGLLSSLLFESTTKWYAGFSSWKSVQYTLWYINYYCIKNSWTSLINFEIGYTHVAKFRQRLTDNSEGYPFQYRKIDCVCPKKFLSLIEFRHHKSM